MSQPSLGSIVRYIGKHGVHAPRAAIVTCTQADIIPGGDVHPLSSDTHVHLHVLTADTPGFFVEFDIPFSEGGEPGTWSWLGPTIPDVLLDQHFTLMGDEDCGVGIYCRRCDHGGRPVAYYVGVSVVRFEPPTLNVDSIADLLQAAADHHQKGEHV